MTRALTDDQKAEVMRRWRLARAFAHDAWPGRVTSCNWKRRVPGEPDAAVYEARLHGPTERRLILRRRDGVHEVLPDDAGGGLPRVYASRASPLTDRVVDYVRANPGATSGRIAVALRSRSARAIPPMLVSRGRLVRVMGQPFWRYYVPGAQPQAEP